MCLPETVQNKIPLYKHFRYNIDITELANISSKSYSNYTFLNRFTSNNQTVCESVLFDPILHQWLLLPFWVSRYRKGKGFPILRRRNGKKGCHGPIQEIQQKENDPGYDLLAGVRHQIFFFWYMIL